MHVVFAFCLNNSIGGAERRLIRIYNEICSKNNDIKCDLIVVHESDEDIIRSLFKQADCDLDNINNVYVFKKRIKSLRYILFSRKYNVIHFFRADRFNTALLLIGMLTNKKRIYSVCVYPEAYNCLPQKNMLLTKLHLRLSNKVDLLYPKGRDFVSKYVRKEALSITPGTFTNLNTFKPQKKSKTIVFCASRLEDAKNPMLFIECINECKNIIRNSGYNVILLGKGKYEDDIKQFVNDNQLTDIVFLAGYDKTSDYLPNANVFFSVQQLENYPSQSLAEATACGCYLIITDVGDSRKCADNSFAAFVNANTEELSQALIRYIGYNDEKKREIVSNAREFAEKNYMIEKSQLYYLNILRNIFEKDTSRLNRLTDGFHKKREK